MRSGGTGVGIGVGTAVGFRRGGRRLAARGENAGDAWPGPRRAPPWRADGANAVTEPLCAPDFTDFLGRLAVEYATRHAGLRLSRPRPTVGAAQARTSRAHDRRPARPRTDPGGAVESRRAPSSDGSRGRRAGRAHQLRRPRGHGVRAHGERLGRALRRGARGPPDLGRLGPPAAQYRPGRRRRAALRRAEDSDAQDPSAASGLRRQRVPGGSGGAGEGLRRRGGAPAAGHDPHRDLDLSGSAQPVRRSDGGRRRRRRLPGPAAHPGPRRAAALHGDRGVPGATAPERAPGSLGHSARRNSWSTCRAWRSCRTAASGEPTIPAPASPRCARTGRTSWRCRFPMRRRSGSSGAMPSG